MDKEVCQECRMATVVVGDHAAGNTVCSECGLVLEAHYIDETSEWRSCTESFFNDRNHVGDPSQFLLENSMYTAITKRKGAVCTYARMKDRSSYPSGSLNAAFRLIVTMADRLELVPSIKERAKEIYKKVDDPKFIRYSSHDAILGACLYIACRQADKPRTFKEICSVANGASKKEIGRAAKFIVKQFEERMGTIHAGDFLVSLGLNHRYKKRFCSHLGMTYRAAKATIDAVKISEQLDIRKSPISIAAAAIYMISQLSDDKNQLRDISAVTGVCERTIRDSYRDLYPHAAKLIPEWFAKEEDLKRLRAP